MSTMDMHGRYVFAFVHLSDFKASVVLKSHRGGTYLKSCIWLCPKLKHESQVTNNFSTKKLQHKKIIIAQYRTACGIPKEFTWNALVTILAWDMFVNILWSMIILIIVWFKWTTSNFHRGLYGVWLCCLLTWGYSEISCVEGELKLVDLHIKCIKMRIFSGIICGGWTGMDRFACKTCIKPYWNMSEILKQWCVNVDWVFYFFIVWALLIIWKYFFIQQNSGPSICTIMHIVTCYWNDRHFWSSILCYCLANFGIALIGVKRRKFTIQSLG